MATDHNFRVKNSLEVGGTVIVSSGGVSSSGNLVLRTNSTDRWEMTTAGHILPAIDNTYDIGSSSKKVRDIYVSDGSIKMGTDTVLSVNADGDFELKDASGNPKNLKVEELELGTGDNKVILKKGSDGRLESQEKVSGTKGTARKAFFIGVHNTGDISEGTNKFYTDARVASYLSTQGFATQSNVVASIVDSAPSTLDTLNELAAALGDDANFSTTVTNSIATKLPLAGGTITGNLTVNNNLYIGDGNDGYFYNDQNGRTAFANGDFYIQNSVTNYYNYATNQYIGDSSGDNIYFRGNNLSGDDWAIIGSNGATAIGHSSGNMDTTNLRLQVAGNASIYGGNYLYFGITSNNHNSWKNRITGFNTSTLHINSQGVQFDNTGYANPAVVWLKANASEFSHKGNTIWHAGNDGSGSGLDADLLDGLNSSSFLRSDADDAYDGTLTMNGMQFKSSNVNRNLKIQGTSGGTDVGISGFTSDGTHGFQLYGTNSGYYGFLDGHWANWDIQKIKSGTFKVDEGSGLQRVWNAGNDGSGSGLDADLLDGVQGSVYVKQNTGNLIDLFANQNGTNELRLDNNRQDLGNVPVSKVSGRNSVEVANMTFYRGGGGSSGFIRFQNKPTNAASLTDVFQVGDGGTVGYGVDILAGGLRIGGNEVINSSRVMTIPTLKIGDGNDGYFYSDTNGRTAFAGGDFYIQNSVSNSYNYATNQYIGDSSGDNIYFRGNVLSGTGWGIDGAGKLNTRDHLLNAGYHLQRSDHHSGHLEGSYNNVGANDGRSNPIYSIGSAYNPSSTTLGNMYGIGYTSHSAGFLNFTGGSNWGMYVAADGDARVWLDGSAGVISSTGQHYVGSNVVWNAGNDGSGSGLDADLLDGQQPSQSGGANKIAQFASNGYLTVGNWIYSANGTGIYWPSGLHVYESSGNLHINTSGSKYSSVAQGTLWGSSNDGSGSGLDADTLDGYDLGAIDHAEGFKVWTGINSDSTQAKRRVIGRLYGCPNHWSSNWHNIEITLTSEYYESGYAKYRIMGDYGSGSGGMLSLYLVESHGPMIVRAKIELGSAVDAGWDSGGQDVFYQDLYADAAFYGQFKVHAKTYGHGYQTSNPTSGAGITVFYASPSVSNISDFTDSKTISYQQGYTIWNSGNDGASSGLDADLLDGQHGSYYAPATGGSYLPLSGGTMTGTITGRDFKPQAGYHFQRSTHSSGHLEGGHNNIGSTAAKTSPIYTIGSSYNPTDSALSNMYGVGFGHSGNGSFLTGVSALTQGNAGWGQYVASDGDARIFLNAEVGSILSTGQHYAAGNLVWNSGNDGSGSGLDADLLDGQHASAFLTAETDTLATVTGRGATTSTNIALTGELDVTRTAHNYVKVHGNGTYEAMIQFKNANTNYWYAGIRTSAGLGETAGYHIYSTAYGNDVFALKTNGYAYSAAQGTLWGSSNDGSGSGLDADNLDGSTWGTQTKAVAARNLTIEAGDGQGIGFWGGTGTVLGGSYAIAMASQGNGNAGRHSLDSTSDYNMYFKMSGGTDRGFVFKNSGSNVAAITKSGRFLGSAVYLDGSSSQNQYVAADSTHSLTIRNMGATTSGGLVLQGSSGTHGLQMYWDTGGYGFLDGAWASWDIQKVPNGAFKVDEGSGLKRVWNAGNDGSGSGLDADTVDGYQVGDSANNAANKLVITEGNGYISSNYFYTSSNDNGTTAISRIYASQDGYIRYYTPTNFRNNLGLWWSGNDGSGSGLDADLLDGRHLQQVARFQSGSDFADGTLVTTDINSGGQNGDSFVIEVSGKAYGSSRPHFVTAEGYIYNNTIINTNGTNIGGSNFTYLKVMNISGNLCFWWPRHGYWNSYDVHVRSSSAGTANYNRVTAIANSTDPSSATKKIQITLHTSWTAANHGASSGLDADTLDGIQGANFLRSNTSDTVGNGVTYTWASTNTEGLRFTNSSYNKSLYIGGWSGTNSSGISRIRNSNDNLHLDSGSAGNLYLNHYSGGGVYARQNLIWHAGNDGSGSGLDADLLDGQQGSYYFQSSVSDQEEAYHLDIRDSRAAMVTPDGEDDYRVSAHFTNQIPSYSDWRSAITVKGWTDGYYAWQIHGPSSTGNPNSGLYYRDGKGSTWNSSYEIWHAGRDGSGSGLDADTLDGQHASAFQAAGSYLTGNQTITLTGAVTGSGTTSISTSNPYQTSVNFSTNGPDNSMEYQQLSSVSDTKISPSGDWYNSIRMGHGDPYNYYSNTIAIKMTGSGLGDLYTQTISNNSAQGWNKHWHNNNDGSSSGLDADLLDGQHGSYYALAGGNDELRAIPNRWYANANAVQTLDYYQHNYAKAHMGNTYKYTTSRPAITSDSNYWVGSMGWGQIDLNTIFSYGSGFWDSWSTPANAPSGTSHWTGLNALHYSANTGNSQYGMQQAMGAGNPSLFYVRGIWGGGFTSWRKIWNDGNDGSGSGLDADTVDGVHASSLYGVTSVATGGGLTGGTITSTGTISHADTSSVSNVNNSGNTFIQDITFDTYGHVTGVTSATATGGSSSTIKTVKIKANKLNLIAATAQQVIHTATVGNMIILEEAIMFADCDSSSSGAFPQFSYPIRIKIRSADSNGSFNNDVVDGGFTFTKNALNMGSNDSNSSYSRESKRFIVGARRDPLASNPDMQMQLAAVNGSFRSRIELSMDSYLTWMGQEPDAAGSLIEDFYFYFQVKFREVSPSTFTGASNIQEITTYVGN